MKLAVVGLAGLLAALTAAPVAAKSSVHIYGFLDTGIDYVSNIQGKSHTGMQGGALGPSRFGLRGVEDLGDGLRAGFKLEGGINVNEGSLVNPDRLFSREAIVFLGSDTAGTLSLGSMPDLTYEYISKFLSPPALAALVNKHPGNWENYASQYRFANAIKYESPDFAGFSFGAIYGFGDKPSFPGQGKPITKSLGLRYTSGGWRASAVYSEHRQRPLRIRALTGVEELFDTTLASNFTIVDKLQNAAVGVSYRGDDYVALAAFSYSRMEHNNRTAKQRNFDLGGVYFFPGKTALQVTYSHSNLSGYRWDQLTAIGAYIFSKRTKAYVQAMVQRASGRADYAAIQNIGVSSNRSQTVLGVGLAHMF